MADEKYPLGKLLWLATCATRRIPEDRAQQDWRDWEEGEGYFMTKGEWQQSAEVFKAAVAGADALAAIEAAGGIAGVEASDPARGLSGEAWSAVTKQCFDCDKACADVRPGRCTPCPNKKAAAGVGAVDPAQEFFCNKCGYFGPVEVFHERPNGSGKCDYMASPMKAAERRCNVPPPGWSCSREPGHEGPCAARPTAGVAPSGAAALAVASGKPELAPGVAIPPDCCGRTMVVGYRCEGCHYARPGDKLVPRIPEDSNPPNESPVGVAVPQTPRKYPADKIGRAKLVMAAVDDYCDKPTGNGRLAIRELLMDLLPDGVPEVPHG
jgi:hypothetical protein